MLFCYCFHLHHVSSLNRNTMLDWCFATGITVATPYLTLSFCTFHTLAHVVSYRELSFKPRNAKLSSTNKAHIEEWSPCVNWTREKNEGGHCKGYHQTVAWTIVSLFWTFYFIELVFFFVYFPVFLCTCIPLALLWALQFNLWTRNLWTTSPVLLYFCCPTLTQAH